jgi:hypothetical protein
MNGVHFLWRKRFETLKAQARAQPVTYWEFYEVPKFRVEGEPIAYDDVVSALARAKEIGTGAKVYRIADDMLLAYIKPTGS